MKTKSSLIKAAAGLAAMFLTAGIMTFTAAAQPTDVYCFYSSTDRDSFWTTSQTEKDATEHPADGKYVYSYTGQGWQVETQSGNSLVPVYRFYNEETKDHFYTSSEAERQATEDSYKRGEDNYRSEGIAWYAYNDGNIPVYRFFDKSNFNHYYTASYNEMQTLQSDSNYRYEGIAWFAIGLGSNGGSGNGWAGVDGLKAAVTYNSGANNYGTNNSGTYSSGSTGHSDTSRARSDFEIQTLFQQALDRIYDPYGTFSYWASGHDASEAADYADTPAREPWQDEMWFFVGKGQGDGAIPIANAYVNIYTGFTVFNFVDDGEDWVESSFPRDMYLW